MAQRITHRFVALLLIPTLALAMFGGVVTPAHARSSTDYICQTKQNGVWNDVATWQCWYQGVSYPSFVPQGGIVGVSVYHTIDMQGATYAFPYDFTNNGILTNGTIQLGSYNSSGANVAGSGTFDGLEFIDSGVTYQVYNTIAVNRVAVKNGATVSFNGSVNGLQANTTLDVYPNATAHLYGGGKFL